VLLARQPDPRLAAYVVWVPKLAGQEVNVPTATRFVPDARATHYWDGQAVLVHAYDKILGLGQDAWDVFMIYGPSARWDGDAPPRPDFWMHRLHLPPTQGPSGSHMDPAVFSAVADSLVRAMGPTS
jgi:hypothetical protein